MFSERNLRTLILLLYGAGLAHLLWTGAIYRFVGAWMASLEVFAAIALWVLVAASPVLPRKAETAADVGDLWVKGILYAIFALPPVVYLLGPYLGQ